MTTLHYNDLITVRRLKTTSGSIRRLVATATSEASIQPLGKGEGQVQEGQYGQKFIAYLPYGVSVHESDHVRDRAGNEYTVVSVVEYAYGAFPYQELLLHRE